MFSKLLQAALPTISSTNSVNILMTTNKTSASASRLFSASTNCKYNFKWIFNTTENGKSVDYKADNFQAEDVPSYNESTDYTLTPLVGLIGLPGCGKGTISKWIERDFAMAQLSSGDILRQVASEAIHPASSHVKQCLASGQFVPGDLMLELVHHQIGRIDQEKGIILDGYPRTLQQGTQFLEGLTKAHKQIHKVFYIDVPEEEIVRRIGGRRIHEKSGRVYHIEFNPPQEDGLDDVTKEPLTIRSDDNIETIKQRIKAFNEKTMPLLELFETNKMLMRVPASTSKEAYTQIKPFFDFCFDKHATSFTNSFANTNSKL